MVEVGGWDCDNESDSYGVWEVGSWSEWVFVFLVFISFVIGRGYWCWEEGGFIWMLFKVVMI